MTKLFLENLLRFIILLFAQVFLFKNMGYYNIAAPFPYIMFLLLLPVKISRILLYVLAFVTGLTVDMFYDTLGVHAAASVSLAWIRVGFMRLTIQDDDHDSMSTPGIGQMSFRWFFIYTLLLSLVHHLVLFMLEVFSFNNIHLTLSSVLFSCIFTTVLILLFELIFYRRKKR
jgi:rod shape-determining protein MreD